MTEAGISEAVQDRITGHEVKGSTGTIASRPELPNKANPEMRRKQAVKLCQKLGAVMRPRVLQRCAGAAHGLG